MTMPRRARLAISFADLTLLLLGFFVLLQASGSRRDAMLSGVGAQFGARPMVPLVDLRASILFVPGEVMLTAQGLAQVSALGRRYGAHDGTIQITSIGQDAATQRFDSWDMSAARLGAVARALKSTGIHQDRLVIRGLDQSAGDFSGQVIRIGPGPGPGRGPAPKR